MAVTIVLLFCERVFHIGIFDPALGGDPVLFQHLFWFYSHPAVYIMVLPAMGVISELVSTFSARSRIRIRIRGYSSMAIAVIGFLVWGHHLFVSGQSVYAGPGVLVPELLRRHPVSHQGLQLDGHAIQGVDLLRHADALCVRLHRAVHDRWSDRSLLACARIGRPRHRYLLRHRPFPLRHGGRHHHGLPGRPALLVAEDDRPHVSRRAGRSFPR